METVKTVQLKAFVKFKLRVKGKPMFVCPKCGYRDEPCWRSAAFKKYAVYCKLDELEVFRPELAKQLREQNRVVDAIYVYRLSKNDFVYRLLKEFEAFYGSHGITEKPKLVDPSQPKLKNFVERKSGES